MFVEPAVAGDTVYVGSCSGMYYALDAATGAVRWSYDTSRDGEPATFHSNPVIVGDLVITGTDGQAPGYIYAFDRASGEVRWRRLLEQGQVGADLVHADGTLLASLRGGHLAALAVEDGSTRWMVRPAREPSGHGHGSVMVEGSTVYLAGQDQHVYALRLADGAITWTRDLDAEVSTSLAKLGEHLFVGSESQRLYRIDADSGEICATFETGEDPGGNLLAFPGTLLFLGHEPSTLAAAVDENFAALRWTAEPREWTTIRPAVWRGLVLLGDAEGKLIAVKPDTGETVWTEYFRGRIRGVGVVGDTLYVGTTNGLLFSYKINAKNEANRTPPEDRP